MSLRIEQRYLDEMIRHAEQDVPDECCGVLLGENGRVTRFRRCENAEHSPFRYSVAPRELLDIDREARENNWDVLAIYHSHTHTDAYPSPTDVRLAGYPDAVYILVSLKDPEAPVVRAFSIRDGVVTEQPIQALSDEPARGRKVQTSVTENPFRPDDFDRVDETPDARFYEQPRRVVHIDDGAIQAAADLYAELLSPGGTVLDLMSAWRTHLPSDLRPAEVVGLGMNAVELAENPALTSYVVHDLNAQPRLPFESDRFDAVICTVSVQYLTRPVEVFADVYRLLRPDGCFAVTFSNRCFPTKAVRIWQSLGDRDHAQLVVAYFRLSADWRDVRAEQRTPGSPYQGDPLYAVYGRRQSPTAAGPDLSTRSAQ